MDSKLSDMVSRSKDLLSPKNGFVTFFSFSSHLLQMRCVGSIGPLLSLNFSFSFYIVAHVFNKEKEAIYYFSFIKNKLLFTTTMTKPKLTN